MEQTWYRIERRDVGGAVVDWVEVGRCTGCGRGVDREFPREYRDVHGVIYCRECLTVASRPTASSAAEGVASTDGPDSGGRRLSRQR